MTVNKKICLIFRKKDPVFFSIENVFASVLPFLKCKYSMYEIALPFYSNGLKSIVRNMLVAKRQKADIYHVTGDVHYTVLGLPGKKTILTIHDCVFMDHPSRIKRTVFQYLLLKWPVKHCSMVTTISEKSRNDIIRYTGCPANKVQVIPNPLASGFEYSVKEFNAGCPVILFIGSTPNKNLERVVEAVKGTGCMLDIIGLIPDPLVHKMKKEKILYKQSAGLTDRELLDKYKTCDLVLFPSTFEGFGLPIIEAQQTGRPVITSNISPMKEVAGEGACLVDPFSISSIRNGITKVTRDTAYRQTLIAKGLSNAKRYKPEVVAETYAALYKRIPSAYFEQ